MRILKKQKLLKTYVIIMAILCLTVIGLYFSYALIRIKRQEVKSIITIETGTIIPELKINGEAPTTITVPASQETEVYTLTITNTAPIRAKINLYYRIDLATAYVYGYIMENNMLTENGEIFEVGQSATYQVKFVNHSSSDRTVEINVSGGLANKDLGIDNAYLFEYIQNERDDSILIPDDTPMKEYINKKDYEDTSDELEKKNMFAFRHPIGLQQQGWTEEERTDYRYIGADPNNYVTFNGEEAGWRIIGICTVENENGEKEKRIKIMKADSIGNIAWDTGRVNDWTNASLMKKINPDTGETTYNWTDEGKQMTGDAKWYLGGKGEFTSASNGLAAHFYGNERGTGICRTTVKCTINRDINWIGKVGLMYSSDYGYATSGGSTTDRVACLGKEIYNWENQAVSDCKNNDWIYKSLNPTGNSVTQWTLSLSLVSDLDTSYSAFIVHSNGRASTDNVSNARAVRPVVYLASDIQYLKGNGSKEEPFVFTK